MSGVVLQTEIDMGEAQAALDRLSDIDVADLAFAVGELMVTQTKTRIADDKTAPEGDPWVPWSEAYDETRNHSIHSLLVDVGNPGLMESIANYSSGAQAEVGTNLVYGAIHQFGSGDLAWPKNIPARPYLGVSDRNRAEIDALVVDSLAELVR